MRRPSLLVPAIVIVTLLVTASAAPASAASPETGTTVSVTLGLKASNGLRAQLETSDDEMVTLELRRKGRLVTYEVEGEVTETGLTVRFGRLGLIDVAFTPTKTLGSTEPSEGCAGEPRTLREGIFSGKIDFSGERGYVRIEASQAEGSMSVISQWQCPEEPTLFKSALRPLALRPQKQEQSASLHAFGRRCRCSFSAGVHYPKGRGQSIFAGLKGERREGMEIWRETFAYGRPSAFVFDHAAGTATVRPPPPFSGQATFRDRPGARDLWRSTLQVPFLGAAPINPRGAGFQVGLYPEYHFD